MTNGRKTTTTTTTYTTLPCSISSKFTLEIDTSAVLNAPIVATASTTTTTYLKSIDVLWQHWIIRNVQNPERYNSAGMFNVQYLIGS